MKVGQSRGVIMLVCAGVVSMLLSCRHVMSAYEQEVAAWREARYARLVRPMGWVSLAGLYEIQSGVQAFGSSPEHAIRFPAGSPETLGQILLDSGRISVTIRPGHDVRTKDGALFQSGTVSLDDPPVLHWHALYWTFLDRGQQYYLRLWDTLNPARMKFPRIETFPTDSTWRITAEFEAADAHRSIDLPDVLGKTRQMQVTGMLSGQYRNETFELLTLDGGDGSLFVIFEDATTDVETYPAGRYLDLDAPAVGQHQVVIDFNYAYNPPCAYTAHATCLLAPPQNRLSFAVTAGEKYHAHE